MPFDCFALPLAYEYASHNLIKTNTEPIPMFIFSRQDITAELRLCSPIAGPSQTSDDLPLKEFFEGIENESACNRLDIAILTPFNSPEPYNAILDVLKFPPANGKKHRLRLVTSLIDQSHFKEIKTMFHSASDKLQYDIRVLPNPENNTQQLADDALHSKLYVLSKFVNSDSTAKQTSKSSLTPIEGFFGSANFTWKGLGLPPKQTGTHRPQNHHHWELVARVKNDASRKILFDNFEQMFKIAGKWERKVKR